MSILEAIFLGTVQGLSEFLPISSSGHLVFLQSLFGLKENPVFFDILVHFGSFFAIVSFFRKEIKELFKKVVLEVKTKKIGGALGFIFVLIVATLPISIAGLFFEREIEILFKTPSLLGFTFFFTSFLLFLSYLFSKEKFSLENLSLVKAFIIGFFQAIALLPGVSRSGSTVSGGLLLGLKKKDAFYFSFLLGAVAILGATLFQLSRTDVFLGEIPGYSLGFVSAFLASFFALKIFKEFLLRKNLLPFAFYCLILSVVSFLIFW